MLFNSAMYYNLKRVELECIKANAKIPRIEQAMLKHNLWTETVISGKKVVLKTSVHFI